MSKGFLVLANNTADVNYVEQAYALALSIKASQKTVTSISIVTDNTVPEHYRQVFDNIIPTTSDGSRFETESRWKLFHITPYAETIVLDADMLLLDDISYWWEYCSKFDLHFASRILNHKLDSVTDTVHRQAFINNKLSNPYFALHYFKQRDLPLEFYKQLKFVVRNWDACIAKFAPNNKQRYPSMDLASAIAIKTLCIEDQVFDVCSPLEFVHMKPAIQDWISTPTSWQHAVTANLDNAGNLFVSNIKQPALFHYVEKDFLKPYMVKTLEDLNG